jgi:hypothetical protein
MSILTARSSVAFGLPVLVGALALLGAAPAAAAETWKGGRIDCRSDEQARLVIPFRGALHIQWGEEGGMNHRAGPYRSAVNKSFTYDTGAPVVSWRAEVEPDNAGIPGEIGDAHAICVSES